MMTRSLPAGLRSLIRGAPWACALLLLGAPALAHVGPAEGRRPFLDDNGEIVAAYTTWGYVSVAEGCPRRVCEEAVGTSPRWYHRAADGRLLLGTANGVLVSTDEGCSYTPSDDPLAGAAPAFLGVSDGSTLWVATSGGAPDRVLVSTDDGASFAEALTLEGIAPSSLKVSLAEELVVVGGIRLDDAVPVLFVSTDGGENFTSYDTWPEAARVVNAVGFKDDQIALALVDVDGNSELWIVPSTLDSPTVVGAFEGTVTDFATFNGYDFAIRNRLVMVRAPSGGLAEDYAVVEGGPTRCLLVLNDQLWGCSGLQVGTHFLVSEDGLTFDPRLLNDDVDERVCPEGTDGYDVCVDSLRIVPLILEGECVQDFDPAILGDGDGDGDGDAPGDGDGDTAADGGPNTDPRPNPDPTCGCVAVGGPSPATSVLALMGLGWAFIGRRRRR